MTTEPVPVETAIRHVYVLICADLEIRHQLVQACHASIEAGQKYIKHECPYLVACTVPCERSLWQWSERLTAAGIEHSVFREADMGDRATALVTRDLSNEERETLKGLPLYRRTRQ